MMDELDLLIKACRLRGRGDETVDIGIRDGRIQAIDGELLGRADTTIEAQGNLVTESFVNPHLHLDKVFTLTLLDDAGDPGLRTLEMMAIKTLETGWQGKVLAHHARAMALYPVPYFQKLAALLAQAAIPIVCDPHTGPLHARVKELRQESVVVCLAQDDISDAYYPYGHNNMLEVAFLASHLLWMTTREDMEVLYDMVTVDAAAAMGIEGHTLKVGSPANLVVLQQPDVLGALRFHQPPMAVISGGKLLEDLRE